jgi:hypothetical protein
MKTQSAARARTASSLCTSPRPNRRSINPSRSRSTERNLMRTSGVTRSAEALGRKRKTYGRLDCVFNNARVLPPPIEPLTRQRWEKSKLWRGQCQRLRAAAPWFFMQCHRSGGNPRLPSCATIASLMTSKSCAPRSRFRFPVRARACRGILCPRSHELCWEYVGVLATFPVKRPVRAILSRCLRWCTGGWPRACGLTGASSRHAVMMRSCYRTSCVAQAN